MAIINGIPITAPIITGSTVAQSAITNGIYFESAGKLQQSSNLTFGTGLKILVNGASDAFIINNAANSSTLFKVTSTGALTAAGVTSPGMSIAQPAGQYYPTLSFSNNGGSAQGSIFGYNGKLNLSSSRITPGNTLSVNFSYFDANYAQLEVLAKSALATDNAFGIINNAITGYHLKVNNAGNVQVGVGGLSICRTDNPGGTLIGTITYRTDGSFGSTLPLTITKIISPTYAASYMQLDGYRIINQTSGSWADAPDAFVFQSNGNQGLNSANNNFIKVVNGASTLFVVKALGNVGIGTTSPSTKLHVTIDNNTYAGNTIFENINTGTSAMAVVSFKTASNASQFTIGQVNNGGGAILYNAANTDMTFSTNASTRMTIAAGGNVGIGTTSPETKLHTAGNITVPFTHTYNAEGSYTRKAIFATGWNNNGDGRDYLTIQAPGSSSSKVVIDASNVGIGTIAPNYTLDVNGTFHSGGDAYFNGTNFYLNSSFSFIGNNTTDLVSIAGNTMYFPGNGNIGVGTTSPGYMFAVRTGAASTQAVNISDGTGNITIGHWDGANNRIELYGKDTYFIQYGATKSILFGTNGNEVMRLDPSGNVGIGINAPDASALLHLESITKGFLPPRMSQGDIYNIVSPANGLVVFNVDREELNVYTQSQGWRSVMYV